MFYPKAYNLFSQRFLAIIRVLELQLMEQGSNPLRKWLVILMTSAPLLSEYVLPDPSLLYLPGLVVGQDWWLTVFLRDKILILMKTSFLLFLLVMVSLFYGSRFYHFIRLTTVSLYFILNLMFSPMIHLYKLWGRFQLILLSCKCPLYQMLLKYLLIRPSFLCCIILAMSPKISWYLCGSISELFYMLTNSLLILIVSVILFRFLWALISLIFQYIS